MSSEAPAPGALHLEAVTKVYDRRAAERWWRQALPTALADPLAPVVAVDRVDLEVAPGETVGIIGPNGAGKSTVLKLIAGVTEPTSGTVRRGGRLGAMIELGLGFHPDLDGWENVRAGAALMGLDRAETEHLLPEIVEFAGVATAMDEPLRHFSTGMRARLGFALATAVPADLLVVDEVLAVGDPDFQQRCIARIHEHCGAGTTLLLVSHEMWLVDSVCERAVHLDGGTVVADGPAPEVIDRYLAPVAPERPRSRARPLRFTHLAVERPELGPWQPVDLRAGVDVAEPVEAASLEVSFSWATIAPDFPIAQATWRLPPEALVPGHHELVGRGSPIPTDTGHVAVRGRLVDTREGTTFDDAEAEFWIARHVVGRRPQLAVDVDWHLEPVTGVTGPPRAPATHVDGDVVARLEGVTKRFHTGARPRLDRRLLPGRLGAVDDGDLVAVDEVDLALARGTTTGLIGPNGAGKTTLLRLLAGTMAPTRGRVWAEGRVVSMLELGLGFHPDRPGRENVALTAQLLGLSPQEVRARTDAIVEFADLGDAVDAPVKQYSSGMKARLGLATALHTDPDLLLIDETLAVGDERFRERAILAVDELRDADVGVVFVSHDLRLVEEVCDRVVRLEQGRVVADGPATEVLAAVGGSSWSGGTSRTTTAIGLGPLDLARHRVVSGGRLEASGLIEVGRAVPSIRLELRYRVRFEDDRPMTPEEEAEHTVLTSVLEPAGGRLVEPGWYRYRLSVDRNAIAGDVAVLVCAVDEHDERVVAEAWQAVTFGNPRPGVLTAVSCPVEVSWSLAPT